MDVVEKDESSEEPAGLSEAITQREELIFNEGWLIMSKTTQLKSLHQRHPRCVGKAWKNGVGVDESARPGEWAWPSRGHLGACTQCHTGPSLALERGLTWGLTLGWTLPSLGWELEHPKPGFAKGFPNPGLPHSLARSSKEITLQVSFPLSGPDYLLCPVLPGTKMIPLVFPLSD